MKTIRNLAAAMMVLAVPAFGQERQSGMQGPDSLPAGVYEIDSKETLVRYGTVHMGFNEFWGTFPGATGTLTINPKMVDAAKLDVMVPVAMVETTNQELNGALVSDTFFDAKNYPSMHFVSTEVMRTGAATAKVTGNLTMHGVTRPVVLDVTFNAAGPNAFDAKLLTAGFKAVGMVNRSDFGLGKWVPIVSDATSITISVAFVKK
ncbi:MAG: YceI family protein [Azospirillaceae bacterium]|nr:YceI family protein [Azospirillaceae bacterium]